MRLTVFAAVGLAWCLFLGAPAHATSTQSGGSYSGSFNIVTSGGGWSLFATYFQTALSWQSGGSSDGFQTLYDGAFRSFGGTTSRFNYNWVSGGGTYGGKDCGDAGFVPEPGAVGVFSVGLLVAGASIRRLRRRS